MPTERVLRVVLLWIPKTWEGSFRPFKWALPSSGTLFDRFCWPESTLTILLAGGQHWGSLSSRGFASWILIAMGTLKCSSAQEPEAMTQEEEEFFRCLAFGWSTGTPIPNPGVLLSENHQNPGKMAVF